MTARGVFTDWHGVLGSYEAEASRAQPAPRIQAEAMRQEVVRWSAHGMSLMPDLQGVRIIEKAAMVVRNEEGRSWRIGT